MTTEIKGLCRRVLSAMVASVCAAACGVGPSGPGLSPTAPLLVTPDVQSGIVSVAAATSADLGACLRGAAGMECFNAGVMPVASVASNPVTSAPIALSSAVIGSTVSLVWTPPPFQDAPVTSYVVEAGSTPQFAVPNLANFDTGNAVPTITASGVPSGIYYVRIRARNALGLSPPSNEVQVIVGGGGGGGGCPDAPRSLSAIRAATGVVSLSWLAPSSGSAQSYIIQAGSSPGLSNVANFDTRSAALTFVVNTVPPGSYYLRVRAQASGCPVSPPSNEVLLFVPGPTGGDPLINITLSYTCSPCVNDPDNYAMNVACVSGRCMTFRTRNPLLSPNTITASVRLPPGVHEMEVVVRNPSSPWNLTFSGGAQQNTGGVIPSSFVIVLTPGGTLSFGRCSASGRIPEAVFTFGVMLGAPGSVC